MNMNTLIRRPPSPESPQPYVSFQPKTASLFPIRADEPPPLQVDGLSEYIREFNQTKPYKLHIWSRAKDSTRLNNPVVVRFTIRDVLTAFITLSFSNKNPILISQTVTAFGPRERVGFFQVQKFSSYSKYLVRNRLIRSPITSYIRISPSRLRKWCNHILACLFRVSWYAVYLKHRAPYPDQVVWDRTSYALIPASSWIGVQTASAFSRSRVMCRLLVACG
jgi:hypothetical protein